MTSSILDPILESPLLYKYIEELKAREEQERAGYQRFLETVTEDMKAEYINGEMIVHSPNKDGHNLVRSLIGTILRIYVRRNNLGLAREEKALIKLSRNAYEPDVVYFGPDKAKTIHCGVMEYPAPDLVVELLSESTERRDRGIKMRDYAAHGIGEYWIVDWERQIVEQYLLRGAEYALEQKAKDGSITCSVIPGLKIPVLAFFDEEESDRLLERILAIPPPPHNNP